MARLGTVALILAAMVVVIAACGDSGPPPERLSPDEIADREEMARGRAAFDQAGCGECHVVDATLAVLEGPDLSYYAQRPISGSGAVDYRLNPSKSRDDHQKVSDRHQRQAIARFLGRHCKLEGYVAPPRDSGDVVKCPVTGLRIVAKQAGAWRQRAGSTYYFPDEMAARKFDLDPAHFTK